MARFHILFFLTAAFSSSSSDSGKVVPRRSRRSSGPRPTGIGLIDGAAEPNYQRDVKALASYAGTQDDGVAPKDIDDFAQRSLGRQILSEEFDLSRRSILNEYTVSWSQLVPQDELSERVYEKLKDNKHYGPFADKGLN